MSVRARKVQARLRLYIFKGTQPIPHPAMFVLYKRENTLHLYMKKPQNDFMIISSLNCLTSFRKWPTDQLVDRVTSTCFFQKCLMRVKNMVDEGFYWRK